MRDSKDIHKLLKSVMVGRSSRVGSASYNYVRKIPYPVRIRQRFALARNDGSKMNDDLVNVDQCHKVCAIAIAWLGKHGQLGRRSRFEQGTVGYRTSDGKSP